MKNRQYVITERAHFMCPNMHFGIKARIRADYDANRLEESFRVLENAHPFLKSKISTEDETGKLYYEYFYDLQVSVIKKEDANHWADDYRSLNENGWNVHEECLLKVIVYPSADGFEILMAAHHLLADGRGLLSLMCEFAEYYSGGNTPLRAEEQLISSISDLPKGSDLSLINRIIINKMNRDWEKEDRVVTYDEYRDFEREFICSNPINITEETMEKEAVSDLNSRCKEQNLSLNDYLVAEMIHEEHTNRVVIAADIRKQLACYRDGALGNYATATSIEVKATSYQVMETARQVSKQVRANLRNAKKAMMILACYLRLQPQLIDAAAISTMGNYKSKAGKFLGTVILGYEKRNAYSVTNLGNINFSYIEEAMFIPPASPANKTTMGVISVNGCMKKCTVCYGDKN